MREGVSTVVLFSQWELLFCSGVKREVGSWEDSAVLVLKRTAKCLVGGNSNACHDINFK